MLASSIVGDIITLLWTNPSSTLAESDVVLGDLSAYRFIDIEVMFGENNPTIIQRFRTYADGYLSIHTMDTSLSGLNTINFTVRTFTWKDNTTIHFQLGNMVWSSEPYKSWNNRCVPKRIWGVK